MKFSFQLTFAFAANPLRVAHRRCLSAAALLIFGWPTLAVADCVDTRKATPAELDFHSRAMAALVSALPPVPVGGKLQNPDSVTSLGAQCKGTTGDFSLEAKRFYELNYRKSIVSVAINARQLPVDATGLSATYGTASPNRSAALKVNNVVWTISGSDSPLRQALVDAMDRPRMQAWVGNHLPSVAESQAIASQAVPASVSGATPAEPAASVPAGQAVAQPTSQSAPEPIKETVDAVNKLRGLFGR